MHLTVVHDFTSNIHDCAVEYKRGDKITDPDLMKAVMASENHTHVVRTADLPKPAIELPGSAPEKA